MDTLLLPENVDQLRDILLYHAVNESLLSTSLESRNVTTLNGDTIEIIVLEGPHFPERYHATLTLFFEYSCLFHSL